MKRFLKGLAIALGIVIILLMVGILSGHFLDNQVSLPLPEDDHLKVIRVEIPDAENALTYFKAATNISYLTSTYSDIEKMMDEGDWDTNLINEIIKTNEISLIYIEKGIACSKCQVPEITGLTDPLPYFSKFRPMAKLMSLKTRWLFKMGKEKEAFTLALQIVKFGDMIEDSNGSLIHYLVGIGIKGIGLARIEDMVDTTSLSSEALRYYSESLSQYPANEEGLRNAFKIEHRNFSMFVDDLFQGKQINDNGKIKLGKILFHMPKSYLFQPKRTKKMIADLYITLIEDVSNTYSKMKISERTETIKKTKRLSSLLKPNGFGRMYFGIFAPVNDAILQRKCRDDLSVSMNQTLLALRAYKKDNGELPENLKELTPKYMQDVPRDPYDGKPIRYSAEKRFLYSVGKDLKDSGGTERSSSNHKYYHRDRWRAEDITFRIEF